MPDPESAAASPASVSGAPDDERVREHAAVALSGVVGNVLVAGIAASVDYVASNTLRSLIWLVWLVPSSAYRLILVRQFRENPHRHSSVAWLRRFRASLASIALAWGLSAFVLLPAANLPMQTFWIFTIGGLSAGGSVLMAFDMPTGLLFTLLVSTPTIAKLLIVEGPLAIPMALLSAWHITYTALASRRAHARVLESATLRNAASVQAARLQQANEELERQIAVRTSALKENEERFRAVFHQSPVAITLIDLHSRRVTEVNDVALRAFGYNRDEALGRKTTDLGVWADDVSRDSVFASLKQDGRVANHEIELRRRTGEHFWALMNASVISIGGAPFMLAAFQDITERRQLQANALQAQKMEVVGHLAGGIAHDFNNVLTVITTTAELALGDVRADAPLYESLGTIRDASARAAGLTAKLLAFSRQQILQPTVLDVNGLLEGLTPMLTRLVGARIALETRLSETAATIEADRGSIEQVLLNLAINSRDAMPTGGRLTIAVDRVTVQQPAEVSAMTPGTYVRVVVADTGEGMSSETLAHIFEPFFTTKEVGKGTGLGLATVHGIVSQSGGRITVDSAPDVGTTFRVYLPWTNRPAEAQPPKRSPASGGSETILVVDDDPDIRGVVKRVLSSAGYRVLLAGSGDEAVALLQGGSTGIDLMLTDVIMPGLSGQELASRVRVAHPRIRILLSSGYADDAIAHHGALSEGVHFIGKPYSPKALRQKVRDVLDALP